MIRRDCGRILIVLTSAVLTLLVLGFYVYRGENSGYINIYPHRYLSFDDETIVVSNETTEMSDSSSRLRTSINITLTTGASSREFLILLQFVESLIKQEVKFTPRLVVWDLGLRACQVNFLLKRLQQLGIQLQVKDFPFTSYPLYFRSIKGIWKPVAIKKVVDEFGAALWVDPELQLNKHLTGIVTAVQQNGFAAVSSSLYTSTCSSSIVGFQNGTVNAHNILKEWSQLALQLNISDCKYSSTIAKASCGKVTVNWADHTLSLLVPQPKRSCQ